RILTMEKEPCFYGYEERFSVGNTPFFRRGFFAALRVETPGKGRPPYDRGAVPSNSARATGRIRPHERTFPKHKEDRLLLMRASHANVSPIFGIFFDKDGAAQK